MALRWNRVMACLFCCGGLWFFLNAQARADEVPIEDSDMAQEYVGHFAPDTTFEEPHFQWPEFKWPDFGRPKPDAGASKHVSGDALKANADSLSEGAAMTLSSQPDFSELIQSSYGDAAKRDPRSPAGVSAENAEAALEALLNNPLIASALQSADENSSRSPSVQSSADSSHLDSYQSAIRRAQALMAEAQRRQQENQQQMNEMMQYG